MGAILSIEEKRAVEKAMEILKNVKIKEFGETFPPKYINLEILTPRQAERKGVKDGDISLKSKVYPTTTIFRLECTIVL